MAWFDRAGDFASDSLHVVERYTRRMPITMNYEATIEDPAVVYAAVEDQPAAVPASRKRTRSCWSSSAWSSPRNCCTAT